MIHILLTTLKVIGILLAILLGIIVSLILVLLFVPIRYKAKVVNMDVDAKATWLLHLVTVNVWYKDQELKYIMKVLGIDINKFKKKEPEPEVIIDDDKKDKPKEVKAKEKSEENAEEKKITTEKKQPAKEEVKKSLKEKIIDIINNFKFKIKNIYDKIISIKDKITDYKEFLTTDESKSNIKDILKLLFDLLVYILPTKLKGAIKFGFEDPETTGKTLAVVSMFYGLYGNKIELYPNFEEQVFDANVRCKGRIRLYRVLIVLYKLWKNEWIKKFVDFAKTH